MSVQKKLLPNYRFNGITDITLKDLEQMNVRGLILDIDNTIAPDAAQNFFDGVPAWIEMVENAGYKIGIITNALPRRSRWASKALGVPAIGFAMKPLPFNYWRMARKLGLPMKKIAVVGDQIFTDVRGANFAGAVSVYVTPQDSGEKLIGGADKRREREKEVLKEYDRIHGDTGSR